MPYKNIEDKKAHNQRYYELNKEQLNASKKKRKSVLTAINGSKLDI